MQTALLRLRPVTALALITTSVALFATLPTGQREAVSIFGKLPVLPPNTRPSPRPVQPRPDSAYRHNEPNQANFASLNGPHVAVRDPAGTKFYVADTSNNRVLGWLNIDAAVNGQPADIVLGQGDFGVVRVNSGFNVPGFTPPWCNNASMNAPSGLAVDSAGGLWVSDSSNNRLLRFPEPFTQASTTGKIRPDAVIGHDDFYLCQANRGFSTPNYNTLNQPRGLAIFKSTSGNPVEWLYVADSLNNRILRYDLSLAMPALGNATGVWGQPGWTTGLPNCGSTVSATCLRLPTEVVTTPAEGHIIVADNQNNRVVLFRADPTTHQALTTAEGVWGQYNMTINGCNQGAAAPTDKTLCFPRGVALTTSVPPQLIIADNGNNRVLVYPGITTSSTNVAANAVIGQSGFITTKCNAYGAGPQSVCAPAALFMQGAPARLWVADLNNHRMLRFDTLTTAATAAFELGQNNLSSRTANGNGADRGLTSPNAVVVDDRTQPYHLYVSDDLNNRILGYRDYVNRQLNLPPDLVIGQPDFISVAPDRGAIGPGPAFLPLPANNSLYDPGALAVDANGNLWVADQGNNRVLRFPDPFNNPAQTADIVLGQANFTSALPNHGLTGGACDAQGLHNPAGVAVDGTGVWVADQLNNRLLHYPAPINYAAATEQIGQANMTTCSFQATSATTVGFPTQMTLQTQTAGAGTGTITTMVTSTTVTGTGTLFTTQQAVGGTITVGGVLIGTVASITNNTTLILNANALATVTGANFTYRNTARKLWVADGGNNRTVMYNLAGATPLSAVLCLGEADCISRGGGTAGPFQLFPSAVAVNPAGDVCVADTGNNRGCCYPAPTSSGAGCTLFMGQTSLNTGNPNPGGVSRAGLSTPRGIAMDKDSRVIIADADNNRTLVYVP